MCEPCVVSDKYVMLTTRTIWNCRLFSKQFVMNMCNSKNYCLGQKTFHIIIIHVQATIPRFQMLDRVVTLARSKLSLQFR